MLGSHLLPYLFSLEHSHFDHIKVWLILGSDKLCQLNPTSTVVRMAYLLATASLLYHLLTLFLILVTFLLLLDQGLFMILKPFEAVIEGSLEIG